MVGNHADGCSNAQGPFKAQQIHATVVDWIEHLQVLQHWYLHQPRLRRAAPSQLPDTPELAAVSSEVRWVLVLELLHQVADPGRTRR
jgi:hypothetical protein